MAHIMVITSDITSVYNSSIALATQIQRAGHDVTYASPDDIQTVVESHDLKFVKLDGRLAKQHKPSVNKLQKLLHWLQKWMTIQQRQQEAVSNLGVDRLPTIIRDIAPDICLIEIELNPYIMTAVALDIPVALISTRLSVRKHRGLPPLHTSIVPNQGFSGSPLGVECIWMYYRLWKLFFYITQRIRTVGTDTLRMMSLYAEQIGFPFDSEVEKYQWLLPFSYRNLPTLILNAAEFDFLHDDPHPTEHYVGPILLLDRKDLSLTDNPNAIVERLDELFARRQSNQSKALIYCAFGAYYKGDDSGFFRRVMEAVSVYPEWDVVFGLGNRLDVEEFDDIPANVHLFHWIPQLRVLEHADCAIIHGGISSMNECIHFGVPMLSYPFKGVNDQSGSSVRVEYHHLGIVGDRENDSVDKIRQQIMMLLTDLSFKQKVDSMCCKYQTYYEQKSVLHVVEQLLSTHK